MAEYDDEKDEADEDYKEDVAPASSSDEETESENDEKDADGDEDDDRPLITKQRLSKLARDANDVRNARDAKYPEGTSENPILISEAVAPMDTEPEEIEDQEEDNDDGSDEALDCLFRSKVEPNGLQRSMVTHLIKRHKKKMALVWYPGRGKTLGVILGCECLREQLKMQKKKVVVITKAGLVSTFEGGLNQYGLSRAEIEKYYACYSYEYVMNNLKEVLEAAENAIVVIDEVHELKTTKGKKSSAILQVARVAKRLLVMSATPLVNNFGDIYNLGQMMTDDLAGFHAAISSADKLNKIKDVDDMPQEMVDALDEAFRCKVSWTGIIENNQRVDYPHQHEVNVLIEMDPEYLAAYDEAEKEQIRKSADDIAELFGTSLDDEKTLHKQAIFFHGLRALVNGIPGVPSQKHEFIMKELARAQETKRPVVIHSFFKTRGIHGFLPNMETMGIKHGEVSGDIPIKKRTEFVKKFNRGKLDALLITKSGATGVDLKGNSVQINYEMGWYVIQASQLLGGSQRAILTYTTCAFI